VRNHKSYALDSKQILISKHKIQNPLLLLSGFFAGSETALIRIGRIKARSLREKGVDGAKTVQKLVDDPEALLTTMIIGNNIVNFISLLS